jgi:hypothetical protein
MAPRKTPEELQQARKAAKERQEAAKREEQERLTWLLRSRERTAQLLSVGAALYEEFDKHARKWPTMPVTERQLARVNKFLGAVRDLTDDGADDDFAEGLADFVPAGDLPETRDVVLVLREGMGALGRFEREWEPQWRYVVRASDDDEDDE